MELSIKAEAHTMRFSGIPILFITEWRWFTNPKNQKPAMGQRKAKFASSDLLRHKSIYRDLVIF